jgi:CheY-like chemotaxis protein
MFTAQRSKKFRPRFISAEETGDLSYQCFEEGSGNTGLELVPVEANERKNGTVVQIKAETTNSRARMDLLFLCNENEKPCEETGKDSSKWISEPTTFSVFPKPFSKLHQQTMNSGHSSLATIRTITLNVTPSYPLKPIPRMPSPTSRTPSPTSRSPIESDFKPKTEVRIPTPTRLMSVTVTTSSTKTIVTPEPMVCEANNSSPTTSTSSSVTSPDGYTTGRKRVISQVTTTTTMINVLYAEDSEVCRLLTSRTAHLAGVKCDTVVDGIECCKKIEEDPEHYQLILMDIIMPGMDGIDAAARIRNLGLNIPIIALSGVSTQDVKQRCATAGMNGFVSKPLTIAKLKKVLLDQHVSN